MVWRRLFHREPDDRPPEDAAPDNASHSAQPSANPPAEDQQARRVPLHLQQSLSQRQRGGTSDPHARLATLKRRRSAAIYDLEQGELAHEDDNPWKQRASLLTETLETVQHDRDEAEQIVPGPYHPLPQTPIRHVAVAIENDVASLSFTVGAEAFRYEEPLDWAERGHQVIRGELANVTGSVDTLIPGDTPEPLQTSLRNHIELSLFVFATELRERTLNEEVLPDNVTLADLAPPCPVCGGWTDFLGRCQNCARRNATLQQLDRERNRLLSERAEVFEEERRMAERLPVARRRLADIDTEIEAIMKSLEEQA